jgi:dTDP-4-dehydrorhamnose reductase
MARLALSGEILVFGRTGQVAQALSAMGPPAGLSLVFAGREACDLLTQDAGAAVRAKRPVAVINASAYTAVDKAQSEPDAAFRLNRDAVSEMARACADLDIPFVHISTDYVFDGSKPTPYVEDDPRGPISVYGKSKAEGEQAVEAAGGRWSVFRTAWVFSPFGANFVKTMRRLAAERDEVGVVADQWGRPTLAADIAAACLDTVRRRLAGDDALQGIFHLAGADDAVWADVAEAVFAHEGARTGKRPTLKRIVTRDYPTPAARPANSRLDTGKLEAATGWRARPWREAVTMCLTALDDAPAV